MKNYKFNKNKVYKRIDVIQKYLFEITPKEYNSQPLSIKQALEFIFDYVVNDGGNYGKKRESAMGNMKTWFIFGYEKWGGLKPSYCLSPDGKCLKPLFFGLWIKCKYTEAQQDVAPKV